MEKQFEYKEEYAWLTNICLNVTDACNLACRYCFVEQHPHYMTLDVAKQAVHFILDNLEKKNKKFNTNEKASITYFGGEPTLMWNEIIVPLTNYIRENNYPISLSITTNGTLLNKDRIEFLKDNKIKPLLSIDGEKETQEYNRPCRNLNQNSFNLVEKNIPLLLEAFPNTTFRATIYAETVEHTFNNYIYAIKKGFKNIFFLPDSRHPWTEEQKLKLKIELDKIYDFIEFCFENNTLPISYELINRSFEHILKHDIKILNKEFKQPKANRSLYRCGLGTGMGSIGYDGKIYGCQEQTSKTKHNIFYIGDLDKGIDKTKHSKLLKAYYIPKQSKCENSELCKKCELSNICIDFCCPSTSYDLFKDFFIDSELHCLLLRWLFENSVLMMHKLVPKNNELFKQYLNNKCNYKQYFEEGENNGMPSGL